VAKQQSRAQDLRSGLKIKNKFKKLKLLKYLFKKQLIETLIYFKINSFFGG